MFLNIKSNYDYNEFSYLSWKPGQSLRSAQFDSSWIVIQGQKKKNVNTFNNFCLLIIGLYFSKKLSSLSVNNNFDH